MLILRVPLVSSRNALNSSDKSPNRIWLWVELKAQHANQRRTTHGCELNKQCGCGFLTTSNIPMNRKRPTSHQRPIFQVNRQNAINLPALKTENYSMPNKNTKTSHRVVLVKGEHHWRFEWSPGQEIPAVKAITEIAKSTETDFDWFDAAMVCHEMSKITSKAA